MNNQQSKPHKLSADPEIIKLLWVLGQTAMQLKHSHCHNHKGICKYKYEACHEWGKIFDLEFNVRVRHIKCYCTRKPSLKWNLLNSATYIKTCKDDFIHIYNSDPNKGPVFRKRVLRLLSRYVVADIILRFNDTLLTDPKQKSKAAFLFTMRRGFVTRIRSLRLTNMKKYGHFTNPQINKAVLEVMMKEKKYYDKLWDHLGEKVYFPLWSMFCTT